MAKEKKIVPPARAAAKKVQALPGKPLIDFSNILSADQEKLFKYAFIVVAVLIFIIRPMFSSSFGPSGDEITHRNLGDLSYDYLSTFGKNDSVFRYTPNQREDATLLLNYGPMLEVMSSAIYKNVDVNPYKTRHFILTVFTFLLFFYCGMAAYKIGGWRAGLIAMVFMLVSPRIFGESFNNPKDPPFAAGYMMALYGLICLVDELPKPSWKSFGLTMVGIGLAFSIRVGGLLLFPYTFIFVALALALKMGSKQQMYFVIAAITGLFTAFIARQVLFSQETANIGSAIIFIAVFLIILTRDTKWKSFLINRDFAILSLKIVGMLVGAWIIGIISWPAALRNPFGFDALTHSHNLFHSSIFAQPLHALAVQSQYPTVISVLYDGKVIGSNEVPWTYNPFYITATSPAIVIIGLFLGLLLLPFLRKTFNGYYLFMILFVSAFPIFWIIYQHSALLNGWRHSYFTYTGIAVFAALTFEALFRIVKPKAVNYILAAILAVGVFLPAYFIVKNFPVDYVYFNEFVGGVDGTYGDYNLDYYACSAKPAADWIAKNIPYDSTKVIVSNNGGELNECFKMDKSPWLSHYIRYRERNEQKWDYAVFLPQFVDPEMMKKGYFAPKGTIHKIMVGNSLVACIVKRENEEDVVGIAPVKKIDMMVRNNQRVTPDDLKDIPDAIGHLQAAVNADDKNEIALTYLGMAYYFTGHRDDAAQLLNQALTISPNYQLAQIYMQQVSR